MNFNQLNLKKEVLEAIDKLGFKTPTKIQEKIIPYILDGKDVIGQSETGTGKTLAFSAGILSKLEKNNYVKTLILTPTRELAIQIAKDIEELNVFCKYKILAVYGNSSIEKQIDTLKRNVDIVVGTPGRVMDLIKRRKLNLENLQFFVLDEADEMLKMGFREDIEEIFRRTKRDKQVLLFSATMQKPILKLAKNYMKDDYQELSVVSNVKTSKNIEQRYYLVNRNTRTESMCRIMDNYNPKKALIFCKTKKDVDKLYEDLLSRNYSVGLIHGDIVQRERINILEKFRKGLISYLIATDVAARGIHVDDIEIVFNYNLPQDNESYVHRIGRTGRVDKHGLAISFVTKTEEKILFSIMKHIQTDINIAELPGLEDIISERCSNVIEEINKLKVSKSNNFSTYLANLSIEELRDICEKLLNKELLNKIGSDFSIDTNVSKEKKRSSKNKGKNSNETRVFITIGKIDKIDKKSLLAFLEEKASIPKGSLSGIDILTKFTFMNVDNKYLDKLLKKCNNVKLGKRTIKIAIAK